LPGTARHIYSSFQSSAGDHDLPEGNAAIVGRHALVPIGPEPGLLQAAYGPLRQVTILEAASAQHHPALTDLLCHLHDRFDECVMKPGSHSADGRTPGEVLE
jgi:hypothetical protein